MHLKFGNVNEAFDYLVRGMAEGSFPTRAKPSRVGDVLQVEEPVTITYLRPRERVLFNTARDCNHFFHLFEGLWMLAGSNNVQELAYYNPKMMDYSDNGHTLHGAYGHRWQSWPLVDGSAKNQLLRICASLKMNPGCRRQVLSVWSAERDLGRDGKDLPCNVTAFFAIQDIDGGVLDMTVCNRSNDLIWGMLGANVVHWSMLQEYMAAVIGVNVGHYHQFTNNLHVYTDQWKPEEYLNEANIVGPSVYDVVKTVPLVTNSAVFQHEVRKFVYDGIDGTWKEPFLATVAQPMLAAFRAHKQRRYYGDNSAMQLAGRIHADDWRIAAQTWLQKRICNWEAKNRKDA